VLQAAQAFFESASSLEAEEMALGQITLGLLPHDPEVQQQGSCLQALQELQDYGLQLLPAAYNQVGSPFYEVIRFALSSTPSITWSRPSPEACRGWRVASGVVALASLCSAMWSGRKLALRM